MTSPAPIRRTTPATGATGAMAPAPQLPQLPTATPHHPAHRLYALHCSECGAAERLALTFLHSSVLRASSFERLPYGSLRLRPQLARDVYAACRVDRQTIADDARWLRDWLVNCVAHEP